ncbi:ABC transporter substrate-binding protein [Phyllobacterium sp. SB3]|uniref:ABC transporter substrate-binding protein n=1 Tax=Phyllobacterium sp. SB3 TaxID=3156073 RepID=UPI0032AF81BA
MFATASSASEPSRIVAIDWAMLETLMALGITPVAATELIQFRKDVVEPELPSTVVDLGLRGTPNLELLYTLKPDLILSSPFYARHEHRLAAVAPILSLPFYIRGEPPFIKALAAVEALGERLGRQRQAAIILAQTEANLTHLGNELRAYAERPTYLVNIGDARHVRIFGSDSMFGDVFSRLGLPNAWEGRSRYTFSAPVPIEHLAAHDNARIVVISEVPIEARTGLADSMIWNALAPVRQNRVTMLGNINPYGGITAGLRFARLVSDAFLSEGKML